MEEFRRGLEIELEHGARDVQTQVTQADPALTGRIAWAHLNEIGDYSTRLDQMEAEAEAGREARALPYAPAKTPVAAG